VEVASFGFGAYVFFVGVLPSFLCLSVNWYPQYKNTLAFLIKLGHMTFFLEIQPKLYWVVLYSFFFSIYFPPRCLLHHPSWQQPHRQVAHPLTIIAYLDPILLNHDLDLSLLTVAHQVCLARSTLTPPYFCSQRTNHHRLTSTPPPPPLI
jgi:thiol:disulfide interchange protein